MVRHGVVRARIGLTKMEGTMGGRGTYSGTHKYGEEFRSIAEPFMTSRGEVKAIESRISKNNKRVYLTQTDGRIYATVNKNGEINNLFFFGSDGLVTEEWNLRGKHGNIAGGHKHLGFQHSGDAVPLSARDNEFVSEVKRLWKTRTSSRRTSSGS